MDLHWQIGIDVQLHSRSIHQRNVLEDLLGCLGQVALGILVLHVTHRHVQLELRSKVNAVLVLRNLIWNLHPANDRSFIGPASRHIPQSIASTSNENSWDIESFDKSSCRTVPLD